MLLKRGTNCLTLNCYSEFLQKDIDKFKVCQTNESTKRLIDGEKKSMEQGEANSNVSYCN